MPKILSRLSYVVTLAVVEVEKCFAPKWKPQAMPDTWLKSHRRSFDLNEMAAISKCGSKLSKNVVLAL